MELSVELITRAQAAELLTVSEDTVDRLVKAGQLPAYKISPKITRFDRADVEEYLASRYVKAKELQRKTRVRRPNEFRGGVNNSGYYPADRCRTDGRSGRTGKSTAANIHRTENGGIHIGRGTIHRNAGTIGFGEGEMGG